MVNVLKPASTLLLMGCWSIIKIANSQADFRGLLDLITSGEASIDVDTDTETDADTDTRHNSRERRGRVYQNRMGIETTTENWNEARRLRSTTLDTAAEDYEDTIGDVRIPDPVLIAQDQINSHLRAEREAERSHIEAKEIRKREVKSFLLSKLRLEHLPTPRVADFYSRFPHHIIEGMGVDQMQMDEAEKEDNFHAKIQEMIRFTQQVPQDKQTRIQEARLSSTLYFPMSFALTEKVIDKATLLVYLETPAGLEGETVTLKIITNRWSKQIASKNITLKAGGSWQHLDITNECRSWLREEWTNNLGLVVTAPKNGVELFNYNSSLLASNDSNAERLPLVKLELNEKEYNKRSRRGINSDLPLSCIPSDNNPRCCRYPYVLDFDDLGPEFSFILSPKRYQANYCKGSCPDYILPITSNMQLTRGIHDVQRCCTPSKISQLTLVYLNDENVIVKGVLSGMSISSCGCD